MEGGGEGLVRGSGGMGRSGDGMVAIIRGLQDAGLAVTMMNDLGSPRGSIYAPRPRFPSTPQYPLTLPAGTNTRLPLTSDIGAQIRDDRYTSSYQLAHCNQRPSSPPVRLPEFPLRKPDGPRNQGNFEVSFERFAGVERPASSLRSAGVSTHDRHCFQFPDRGSPTLDIRASEAFADSLRKYPIVVRTPSAELISKLISYTQHKNDANTRKSPRSLPKEKTERERRSYKDKDIQTYTRNRPKSSVNPEEVKSKAFKRMRIHSPAKDSRDKRYKDNQLNETYDYLKSMSPRLYSRAAEVRYLSDMSKCIRETIRQIVDERPENQRTADVENQRTADIENQRTDVEVCTQMHSRYLEHRRRCQSRSSHKEHGESSQEASQINVIPNQTAEKCLPTCPNKTPPCCYCKKRLILGKRDSKEEFCRKVTEKVANWLLDIPTYAKMSPEDRQKRIDIIEELASRLADLKGDEDIEAKARREIEKCLDKIPMWLPSNNAERDGFKSLLADNLMNKLTRVFKGTDRFDDEITKWIDDIRFKSRDSFGEIIDKDKIADTFADRIKALAINRPENDDDYHDALKNEILDMLRALPIETDGNRSIELERLANKLVNNIKGIPVSEIKQKEELDIFDKEIFKWIDTIDLKRKDSQGNVVDKEDIKSNVLERLKSLALNRPSNDEEYHEALKNEIVDILEELPIDIQGSKSKAIEKLATKLTNTLKNIPESEIKQKTDKFDDKISQLLKDIKFKKRDSEGQLIDTRKFADIFADRLKPLITDRPDDDEEHHEALKNEIRDILEELPIEFTGNKSKYIEKIAEQFTNVIKKIPAHEIKQKTETDKFDDKISQWLKNIKFKRKDSQGNIVDKERIVDTLSERLKSIAIERPEDDGEYHEALKDEVLDILKDLPIEFEGNKDKYADKLATQLAKTLKGIPASEIKHKGDKFDETFSQWFKDVTFKRKDSQGEVVDKEKIAETLKERLKFLAIDRPDDDEEFHELLKKEALEILEDLPIEVKGNKEKFIDNLTTKLAKSLKKIPKSEIKPPADKFDQKITRWMKDIKFKRKNSQGEIVDKEKITETLMERLKSLAIDRPADDEDYHEALKDEVLDILKDLPIEFEGNKDKYADKLATQLAKTLKGIPASEIKHKGDKFDETFSQWFKNVSFKRKDSQGEVVDKEKIYETLKERLKFLAIDRPEDDEEFHELLKKEALEILEDLPIEVKGNKEKFIDNLTTKLAKSLKKIPKSEIKPPADKFDQKITRWMKDIKFKRKNSQGEIVDKEKITETIMDRLKSLAIDRPADDDDYHEALKKEVFDILEDLPIEIKGNKDKFVNDLATKLAKTLKDIPQSEIKPKADKFDQKISQLLKDIKFKKRNSQGEIVDKAKIEELFRERLKAIALDRPEDDDEYHDALMNEVFEIIEDLPIEVEGSKTKFAEKIATKFAKSLKNIPSSEIKPKKDKLDQKISQWMRDIKLKKRDSQGEIVDKEKIADMFRERIRSITTDRPEDDEEYHEALKSEAADILREAPIDVEGDKEKHVDKLATKLAKSVKEIPASEIKPKTDKFDDKITQWIKGIKLKRKNSQGEPIDKAKIVDTLSEKLKSVAYFRPNDDEDYHEALKNEIIRILKELPIDVDKNKEQFVEKEATRLAKTLKGIPKSEIRHKTDKFDRKIWQWMRDVKLKKRDDKGEPVLKKKVASTFSERLKPLATKRPADDDKFLEILKSEITNILRKLPIETDGNKEKAIERLADKLAHTLKAIPASEIQHPTVKPESARRKSRDQEQYKGDISKEISASPEKVRAFMSDKVKHAVGLLNIDISEEIEDNLTDVLVEQVLNGQDADFTMEKIMEVLRSANISKEDANDLSMRLVTQARDFSSIGSGSSSFPSEFTLNEREMFQTSAIKEISDFMDEVKGDMDAQTKRKVKTAAQDLVGRLCDTLSDPNQSMAEKEDEINNEVFKFLNRFGVSVEDHGFELANRLRTIAATSTPRETMHEDSFYPKRSGFSIGSIYVPDELKKRIEQNFVSELEAAIVDWISSLPVHINDKALINNIARDLASDIADRQKYLQSHPEVKLTEEEELEFLKYQVFRAMGKSVEDEELATIMSHTPALLVVIKNVVIPVMSKPPLIVNVNKLLDEISMWVEEISSQLNLDDMDYDQRQEKVKELAEKLHKIAATEQNISEKIDSEIAEWLKPLIKEMKHTNMQSMADSLKTRLKIKGIIAELGEEPSISGDQFQQDTSQFLEENLSTGLRDWLKSLPLYQRRNTSEKHIYENIMQELAKDVKKVIQRAKSDTDLDMEILKEAKKHIERLPMEPELKLDKAFIEKTSAHLVDYLKNMQMFENVSGRQSVRPIEHLVSTVNDWIKSLPVNTKSLGTEEIDNLKMDFITRLSEALKDPNKQEDQSVKSIIHEFLKKLPIDSKKANDPKFIEKRVDQLFKNILATPFSVPTQRPTIGRDLVKSAVQSWSKKIPLAPGTTPEHVSDKIQHFSSEISSILENTHVSAVDNYKATLHDKTKQFLKKMPVRPESRAPEKLHDLAENLVTTIKEKAAGLSPKPIPNKNAADVLYDNITTWCEDLPLPEGSTPEEKERINAIKHNLASKLMNKIGELNMNPEILNDDALYEHLIQEEINDLLSDLPHSPEMEANIESIKENLMSKVKEVKEKTQDEFAGKTYKQQLRDTISKTLPYDADLSDERSEPFQVLVDNLADAYLNLTFITDSAEQKAAYKKKIADEITKYCNDYLKRHPEAPLESIKLNQDLFNALKSIPTPKEEILRSEAEQVRMKDEINDWIKQLPLTLDSGLEALQINKMATVLAKKLLDIEKEKEVNPDMDYEEKTQKEIAKLLKNLPIKPGHEAEIDDMIQNLIHKIQSSEQSRRISASTTRQSIDLGPEQFGETSTEPSSEDLQCTCRPKVKHRPICTKRICSYHPIIPASTLSTEDRAHLERIRLRNQPCKIHKVCNCRDASVSPRPIDTGSQTEITPTVPSVCARIPLSPRLSPCMPAPPCVTVPPCSGSEQEVSPQITIKEYLWDSGTSKLLGPVYRLPCIDVDTSNSSVTPLQRKSVSIQPSPCTFPESPPCSTPRHTTPRPCINIRTPCPHETGTSPCPSQQQIPTSRPYNAERTPCPPPPRSCLVTSGSSPCQSHQMPTPCIPPLRPCLNFGTSPCPSQIQIPPLRSETQRLPCSTRPCLGRSPCPSPHQMPSPKPCITVPKPLISSQPSPCPNRFIPYQEIPYCSTPRPRLSRNPNAPFRQPNFEPNSRVGSPIDRENERPCRVLRPRVVNIGDEDSLNPCRRRNEDERISEYQDSYRPRIYREPSNRDDRMRCCRCNHRIRNVCQRHRSPDCPSTENLRHCSKCCGLPCPHPMGMFFK